MKTRETKQKDLTALTESLQNSKSAMVVSFNKLSVSKDQAFRQSLRDAGAEYQVVKNTLARIAVKGTPYESATEFFKGVTGIAWTNNDAVILSKAVSKFVKENADNYQFKAGVVEGKLVNLTDLQTIANLPSKEELIAKLLFVINSSAQRIVTVINAVPRDLAVVIKQIGELEDRAAAAKPSATAASETVKAPAEEAPAASAEPAAETASEAPAQETATEEPAAEAETSEAEPEAASAAPDEAPEASTDAEQADEEKAE